MRRIWFIPIATLLCAHFWGQSSPHTTLAHTTEPVITRSDTTGLSLVWTPPAYSLSELEQRGQVYSQVRMPGTSLSAQPGSPQLPFYSGLIGLPAGAGAQLRIVQVERSVVQLPRPPLPALVPQPVQLATDPQSIPDAGPTALLADPTVYATNAMYPTAIAELGPVQQARNQRVARLTINPLRVNPVTGSMEIIRYLHLEITFDEPGSSKNPNGSSPFDQALASTLVNPQAVQWSAPPARPLPASDKNSATLADNTFKIHIAEAGLYALTYNDLLQAGLPVATLDPRTLQLHHGQARQESALLVEGQADGVLDPADRLLFYAEPEFSRFVDRDVYFLSFDQGAGLRMSEQPVSAAGLPAGTAWRTMLVENNQHYAPFYPGRDGDYWYWDYLRQPDRASVAYDLQLDAPLASGPDAALTLWLRSYTKLAQDPDHWLRVAVNGATVGEQTWDGARAITATFAVPANVLQAENQVTLSLPGIDGVDVEGLWLDALALAYPTQQGDTHQFIFQGESGQNAYTLDGWSSADLSIYDITDPYHPRRLSGYSLVPSGATYTLELGDADATSHKYLVVPDDQIMSPLSLETAVTLDDPHDGADYIIITHPDFAQELIPLAAQRAAQGLRVVTIDVNAIYDTFGSGRMDPEAIKTFLQHAYDAWTPPAPMYVLLVGDGSYDFKNYSGYDPQNFIPPYLAYVDPWWGETASDNQLATLAGDDSLPDLLIGRLPVNTPAEAATVVDKIIQYETNPAPGDWNSNQIFVADIPDEAGDFHAEADEAYAQVTPPFVGYRYYHSNQAVTQTHIYTDAEELRTSFLNKFNQGVGLAAYYGHSSWHQWSAVGLLRWNPHQEYNDVITLHNQYRLPVVLGMTCFTGFFHHPNYPTLDESLLRQPGGGAIAAWGSTGLGISTGHRSLEAGFYNAMMDDQHATNLGTAALEGKLQLYATGLHLDLLDMFNLLGDPAMNINITLVPWSHEIYLPFILRQTQIGNSYGQQTATQQQPRP